MPNQINLTKKELKYRLWLTKYQNQLRLIGKIALIALVSLPWLFFSFYLVVYLTNIQKTTDLIKELVETQIISQEISKPESLVVVTTQAIEDSTGVYDLFAEVTNPNQQFAVTEFDYHFTFSGQNTEIQTSFILPGENKYFTSLNLASTTSVAISSPTANLVIDKIRWKRIVHPEELPDINFSFQDLNYSLVDLTQGSDIQSQVVGKINNKSAYGFEQVKVTVVLYFNNQPIAVDSTYISNFISQETKNLIFTWPKKHPYLSEVKIKATTNNLHSDNLILP